MAVNEQMRPTLTESFSLCLNDAFVKTLLYAKVPLHFTRKNRNNEFTKKKAKKNVEGHMNDFSEETVGRVYIVTRNTEELLFKNLTA